MSIRRIQGEVYREGYEKARAVALKRNPTCQFCGVHKATQAHHWNQAYAYPLDDSVTPNHLTAVCAPCHQIATAIREYYRHSSRRDKPRVMLTALQAVLHAGALAELMDLDSEQAGQTVRDAVLTQRRRCQFCGHYTAQYAHRWPTAGSSAECNTEPDKFTALCGHCMNAAAAMRGHYRKGGKPLPNITGFENALRRYPLHAQPSHRRKDTWP